MFWKEFCFERRNSFLKDQKNRFIFNVKFQKTYSKQEGRPKNLLKNVGKFQSSFHQNECKMRLFSKIDAKNKINWNKNRIYWLVTSCAIFQSIELRTLTLITHDFMMFGWIKLDANRLFNFHVMRIHVFIRRTRLSKLNVLSLKIHGSCAYVCSIGYNLWSFHRKKKQRAMHIYFHERIIDILWCPIKENRSMFLFVKNITSIK